MVRGDYIHMTNSLEQDFPCPVPSKHLNAPLSLSPPHQPSKWPASHISLSPSPHHPKRKHKKGQCKSQLSCPTRRWLMDFYVVEVASGLKFIEANQHQRGVTNTIGALYKEYYGQEMKWLTFKRNQMLWEDIPDSLKDRFIIYGKHARASWPNFL